MPTNQFKTFALTGTATMVSVNDYQDSVSRKVGNRPRTTASSELVNRAIHQPSMLAEAFGMLAVAEDLDFTDTTPENLANQLTAVLNSYTLKSARVAIKEAIADGSIITGQLNHNSLAGTRANNCHPIASIENLQSTLNSLQSQIDSIPVISLPNATTSSRGIAMIASDTDISAGVNNDKIVTPKHLRNTVMKPEQIPNISADKITSGTIDINRLPNIPTDKIYGDFSNVGFSNYTGTIRASQVTSGVFSEDRIPQISTSKLKDRISLSQMPANYQYSGNIAASQITGQITDPQIQSISASKITGTIDNTQIRSVSADKITGTLPTSALPPITLDLTTITGNTIYQLSWHAYGYSVMYGCAYTNNNSGNWLQEIWLNADATNTAHVYINSQGTGGFIRELAADYGDIFPESLTYDYGNFGTVTGYSSRANPFDVTSNNYIAPTYFGQIYGVCRNGKKITGVNMLDPSKSIDIIFQFSAPVSTLTWIALHFSHRTSNPIFKPL